MYNRIFINLKAIYRGERNYYSQIQKYRWNPLPQGQVKNKWQSCKQNLDPRVLPTCRLISALQNPSPQWQQTSGLITNCLICSDLFTVPPPSLSLQHASTFICHTHYGVWSPRLQICKSLHTPPSICSYLSHVLLHQFGSNYSDEAGISPVSNSTGTKCFACARGPKQQYSFGRLNSKVNKSFRL